MRIKCLAQGNNILLPGIEPSTSASKTDILANRPLPSYIVLLPAGEFYFFFIIILYFIIYNIFYYILYIYYIYLLYIILCNILLFLFFRILFYGHLLICSHLYECMCILCEVAC